jgi:hypothetical protein
MCPTRGSSSRPWRQPTSAWQVGRSAFSQPASSQPPLRAPPRPDLLNAAVCVSADTRAPGLPVSRGAGVCAVLECADTHSHDSTRAVPIELSARLSPARLAAVMFPLTERFVHSFVRPSVCMYVCLPACVLSVCPIVCRWRAADGAHHVSPSGHRSGEPARQRVLLALDGHESKRGAYGPKERDAMMCACGRTGGRYACMRVCERVGQMGCA